ncbi:proton-translocating NADH-quinone oxidoreductase, L subunit [Bacteroidetes oral taxon 274 str. F0058]|nr:proton-translocating NADH-quinone oxidoreductase, L subunit [Bacteroidetes oral taxon 274 str. F0058]
MEYSILILITPLFLFLFLGLVGGKLRPNIAGIIGTLGMGFCAVLAYSVAYQYFFVIGKTADSWQSIMPINFEWLRFTELLHIDLGILLDPISVMMLVVITTVSFMVHIYSLGYMHGEVGFQRYYALLSLFSFSMLGLVVATNIFQMYIFWELVGVSSYSLIGFYYQKPSAVLASKKAFIVTRFADLGFLVGILILSYYTKTFDFATLTANNAELVISSFAGGTFMGMSLVSVALALIFMGGAGKSAMFPLHIWLPDAMEGPTPVSALIHAATMVVAGVFLVARLFPVYFFAAPDVLTMIAYIGAFTALFAAVIAITQTDIKRVLAFSTISQIAYMMAALGVSKYGDHDGLGYMASMFHLFTHAFFKALLFLGAGSVIHAVHSNEMKDMGNLHKYMKITSITFLIACLAIAGIPPFSGFFSKDEILAAAFHNQPIIFWTLWIVAGLTAFYMFRLYFGIFFNGKRDYEHKPHESGLPMAIPLMILAVFSVFTGLIPFSEFISSDNKPFEMHIDMVVASLSVVAAIVGIVVAYTMYFKDSNKPAAVAARLKGLYTASLNKFYLDEVWMFITKKVIFNCVSRPIAWFDRHVIDGTMDNIANVTQKASHRVRGLQSGQMQRYVAFLVAGTILIAILVLIFV